MTNDPQDDESAEHRPSKDVPEKRPAKPAPRWQDVFGDLLPDQTSDDVEDPGERTRRASSDADTDDLERFRRDKPPHHVD
jgi:hypothetical protein